MRRYLAPTRTDFIPAGSVKVADRKSDAVAFIYTADTKRGRRFGYAVFYGKQVKPVAHFTADTEADRAKRVAHWFAGRQATAVRKASDRATMKARAEAESKAIAVGDVLKSSWGYEQTNVNFYQVTARKGSTVTLRPIASEEVENGHMGPDGVMMSSFSSYVAPLVDSFIGEAFTKRITASGVKVTSYSNARRLDYQTVAGVRVYARSYASSYA